MAKVVKLVTQAQFYNKGVAQVLRDTRQMVKDEKISGIAIAAVSKDGFTFSTYAKGDNIATLIGAIERLKHRLLTAEE